MVDSDMAKSDLAEPRHRRAMRTERSHKLLGLPTDAFQRDGQDRNSTAGVHDALAKKRWLSGADNIALIVVITGFGLVFALWVLASLRLTVWFVDWLAAGQ